MPLAGKLTMKIATPLVVSFAAILGACSSIPQAKLESSALVVQEPEIVSYTVKYVDALPSFQVAQDYRVTSENHFNTFQIIGLYDSRATNLGYKVKFRVQYEDKGFRNYETSLITRDRGSLIRSIEPLAKQRKCAPDSCVYEEAGLIDISDFAANSQFNPVVVTSIELTGPGLPTKSFPINPSWVTDLDAEATRYVQARDLERTSTQSAKEEQVVESLPVLN